MIICFGVAGFWLLIFGFSFWRDRRLFRNGIYLVLTLMFAGLGMIFALESVSETAARLLVVAILVAIPLVTAVLAVFLVINGVTMLRREGRRAANLPKYRYLIVTNNFHAFRAALTARKAKVNGQVVGSPTAAYYWPTATIREFAAILHNHRYLNGGICLLIAAGAITQHI